MNNNIKKLSIPLVNPKYPKINGIKKAEAKFTKKTDNRVVLPLSNLTARYNGNDEKSIIKKSITILKIKESIVYNTIF